MAITPEQDAEIRKVAAEAKLQEVVDEMFKLGQYKQYVQQAKLELLMGEKGRMIDNLLKKGYLKGANLAIAGF